MGQIATELMLLLVLIAVNGLLALAEIALVSANRSRLRGLAEKGDRAAGEAVALMDRPNHFLSTVQIGITLVGIVAGAIGGARLTAPLADAITGTGLGEESAGTVAVVVVVGAITYLTVVVGELVPKRIALARPDRIARLVARPMRWLAGATAPFVWLLARTTRLILRPFGIGERTESEGPSEADLLELVAHAARRGVIEPSEREIVERLFRLSDRTATDVMTPWERVTTLDLEEGIADPGLLSRTRHDLYPVVRSGSARPLGVVATHDLLERALRGESPLVPGVLRDPQWVGPELPALRLLHLFRASGVHLAVVRDGEGAVLGVVTLDDVLEGVVGDLPDVAELRDPIVRREDGSLLVDASVTVAALVRHLDAEGAAGLLAAEGPTVAALLRRRMAGGIGTGSIWEGAGVRLEVVDMDGSRIDKVLVTPAGES